MVFNILILYIIHGCKVHWKSCHVSGLPREKTLFLALTKQCDAKVIKVLISSLALYMVYIAGVCQNVS